MNELSVNESKILKGIAILFMVGLHLYNRSDINGYYHTIINIGEYPLIYYLSFMFDACVPIYCFCSGYALYLKDACDFKTNLIRIIKLVLRYWIILVITCLFGWIFKNETIPESILTFIGNAMLVQITYVGAWWFMQTYVILIFLTPLLIRIIKKYPGWIIFILSLIIYFVAYYFRMINPLTTNNLIINIITNAIILLGTSQFTFIVGMLFYKYKIISRLRNKIGKNNLYGLGIIGLCFISRIFVKSMIAAPFTAIIFILGFVLLRFNKRVEQILVYFGNHSTNIWLVHMQYYMIFIPAVIFVTNAVIGCLIILLILCLITSYIINAIYSLLLIDRCLFSKLK